MEYQLDRQRRSAVRHMNTIIDETSNLEPAEREALLFLRDHGCDARPVPRSQEMTPEFEVELNGERYLFEVKARRDDDAIEHVRSDQIFMKSQHMFWSMAVYGNVKKAVLQMRQHDPRHERIWIVWLTAEAPIAGDATKEQIRGTLLGTHAVVDLATMTDQGLTQTDCFYAQRAAFEAFRDVDAAVLADDDGYEMWVNEFARPEMTIASHLGTIFRQHRGLNVPKEHEDAGRAFRLPLDAGPRKESDVQAYLRATYGLVRPVILRPQGHIAMAFVPAESGEAT
jgi:hypothetical protein